ncbi:MAG: ribosome biogenesis GTPase Der [Pseudomonadales bacterium]|jgi:GTP-binding protein
MPTLALVGRPNVGKSTLFNRLTRRRDALVADVPGLTRDRRYGRGEVDGLSFTLIDTGGLLGDPGGLARALETQVDLALDEADGVLFVVDARDGVTPADAEIAARLRRLGKPQLLVVNKMDGASEDEAVAEFSALGFTDIAFVSAAHGRGMGELRRWVADTRFTEAAEADEIGPDDAETDRIRVAIIGRPNVGKSTLTNRLLGEDRQVVFDAPGTTRDAIAIPFDRDGDRFLLIDTAGVRRKGRVEGVAEKFSVVKSLKAMEEAHVVVLVMDGREGVVDQDLHLLSHAVESGSGVLVAVNKWDGLSAEHKAQVNNVLDRKLGFAPWIPVTHISALHGSGVGHLMDEVREIFDAGAFDVGTTLLTKLLNSLVTGHPPPSVRGRQIKLRFAHKAGEHPPRIAIHGNQTNALPASYVRYLENGFREALKLVGNPVMLQFRTSENPYADRRNELTPRQRKRRQRVMRHRRK